MIQTEGLSKVYGNVHALKNLDLEVAKGSVFGFIGPNGAGKSTTMLILATLLEPSAGRAFVGGYDVLRHPRKVRKLIGYMPDFFGVYDQFKAVEYLDFFAASYGIPKAERHVLIPQLLELVNLSDKGDVYVDSLSRGMKQRLGLARCLVHDPELLILDEPASGLDPRARIEFREILKELRDMGKTIMISSHILPELADLCDDMGVMENGELVAYGNVKSIAAQLQTGRVVELRVTERQEAAANFLREHPRVTRVEEEGDGLIRVGLEGDEREQAALLRQLVQADIPVAQFHLAEKNLEDVFMEITKGGSDDGVESSGVE